MSGRKRESEWEKEREREREKCGRESILMREEEFESGCVCVYVREKRGIK